MATICPVCEKKIGWGDAYHTRDAGYGEPRFELHTSCLKAFDESPKLYGGISVEQREKENSETIKIQKEATEQKRKEREEKSVYIKGGIINVESFDMPFFEMIGFMVKWAVASIPAFIIVFLIFGALFLMFAAIIS